MVYSIIFVQGQEHCCAHFRAHSAGKGAHGTKGRKWTKALVIVLLALVIALLVYFAFIKAVPGLVAALKSGNEAQIEEFLRSSNNARGILCTALLQILQVVSIVFPGGAIQIAAGIVYGAFRGFVICHLAETLAHALVFFSARNLGATMNRIFPRSEKSASKLDFIKKSGHPMYMTIVAYLVPVLPNGIIPYVAATTNISFLHFALAVFLGTFLPTLVACAAGSYILEGSYLAAVLVLALLGVAAFLLWRFRDRVLETLARFESRVRASRDAERKELAGVVDFDEKRALYRICGVTVTESKRFGFAAAMRWITPTVLFAAAALHIFGVAVPGWAEAVVFLLTGVACVLGRGVERGYKKRWLEQHRAEPEDK